MKLSKTAVALGAVMALAACSDESPVSARNPDVAPVLSAGERGIEGQYIVVVSEGSDPRSVAAVAGVSPMYVYEAALNGFAATLNPGQLNALQHNPNVERIEQDQLAHATTTQSNATWGIDRIDQRSLPLSGTYYYNNTASKVRAYIIDTGLDKDHAEFEGRAMNVYDAFGGSGNDCNGHGTHVGGTVSGRYYGVAKKSMPRGVRVLDCNGSGSYSGIIAGIDWVRANAIKPAVANLSLGGGASTSVDDAVKNLSNSGVFVAVAAGNSNADACNYSPARAAYGTAIAGVAASTSSDAKASFSNWGKCVDLYAPGASIKSAWIGSGTTETKTISGTSMASPHVAGVGALYKGVYGDASSGTVHNWIINNATTGKITSNPSGTPNRLLYKGSL